MDNQAGMWIDVRHVDRRQCAVQLERPSEEAVEVYLDIETLNLVNRALPRTEQLKELEFGMAWAWENSRDGWSYWGVGDVYGLIEYLTGKWVVGYNVLGFDLPVIFNNAFAKPYSPQDVFERVKGVTDLFGVVQAATGRWVGLDALAEATLGRRKQQGMNGREAVRLLGERVNRHHNWGRVAVYCMNDVALCVDLMEHLRAGNSLIVPERPERDQLGIIEIAFKDRAVSERGECGYGTAWLPAQ